MRFSTQDQEVIVKHVKVNSSNLSLAFAGAAEELGRSAKSVCQHYYKYLRPTLSRLYSTKQNNHFKINIKNTPRRNPTLVMASLTKQLAVRESQKRKTDRCVSETARLKAAIRALAKQI